MNVELIAYTQWVDPERDKNPLSVAEQAASVCYGSVPTDTYKIAKGCNNTGHRSVLEHTSFVFHISGVSRALLAQLSRHRHISLSVASQRYQNMGDVNVPDLKINSDIIKSAKDLTEKQKEGLIALYKEGYSSYELSEFYKISWRTVQTVCKNAGVLRDISETKLINKNYFKNIDTPIKAYILGLITTDGNIATYKDGRYSLNITQHIDQRVLLNNIIKEIKTKGRINKGGHDNTTIKIQVQDNEICNDLINLGIIPRKTSIMNIDKILSILDENLLRHFIRGIIDGDGHIEKWKSSYGIISISGSRNIVENIRRIFSIYAGTDENRKIRDVGNTFVLSYYSKKDVINICDWLYKDIDYNFVHLKKLTGAVELSPSVKEEYIKKMPQYILSTFNEIVPKTFLGDPRITSDFVRFCFDTRNTYNNFVYSNARVQIFGEKSFEDARAVLPNACCTELYMTANARALIEISWLRLCSRSQAEIREMFQEIKKQVATVAPEIAQWMVPQCEKNPKYPFCTEAKSCGRHPKLSEVYKE